MADKKISELTNITGANLADGDELVVVDASASETKAITFGEFKNALDTATGFVSITGDTMTGDLTVPNVVVSGNVDGRDVSADGSKLDGIEAGATADQTAGEIKTAYESNSNTNAFTDAEQAKLSGIEASADVTDTANVTAAGALMDSELTDIAAVKALDQGVATTDDPTFTNTQLAEIAATISDTAVDIFVYDTRKDSDGGAWRKRTQHTSWYNETLNTATRGSRKEFPAVAVIVAESDTVTIYDGDDPDLPMWMVFNYGGGNWIEFAAGAVFNTSVSSRDGIIVVGTGGPSSQGLRIFSFIKDGATSARDASTYAGIFGSVSQRNDGLGVFNDPNAPIIVNETVNDVAMTVLPNAPIDAATGLPVPTIAVATNAGVSVITHDGTVVDAPDASNLHSHFAYFTSDNEVLSGLYYEASPYNYSQAARYYIPSSDKAGWNNDATVRYDYNGSGNLYPYPNANSGWQLKSIATSENRDYLGSTELLTLVDLDESDPQNNSLVAYTTSSYNTGWMNGDIKLATLSDTDDTDVTGSELVTNGTFDSDLTGWTISTDVAHSNGTVELTNTAQYGATITQTLTGLEVGKRYILTFHVIGVSGNYGWYIDNFLGNYVQGVTTATGTTFRYEREATSTSGSVTFKKFNAGTVAFDNVSVRLAEEDRSVNGNGLQVFGTVTKNPVNSGADLVAYSAGSNGDGLVQPHNTDLEFGTGDFCFMFWGKQVASPTVNGKFVALSDTNATGTTWVGSNINIDVNNVGLVKAFLTNDAYASNDQVELNADGADGTWYCYALVRRGNTFYGYKNGELNQSVAVSNASGSLTNTDSRVCVLIDPRRAAGNTGYGSQTDVDIALLRISATAPSPEQISRIYNDEKHLFTEGSQATLYGSSDAVTALAYDDSTELLHVGTSAGRSVFQGLRRVDNTTTAVGAAISASNGLVADE